MSLGDCLERGLYEFGNGNFKPAETHFTSVIKGDSDIDKLEAYKRRSTCRLEMGKYQDAVDDAKRVLDIDPQSTSGFALWATALTKLGEFEEALAMYRQGLAIDPNDAEIKKGLKDMQGEILSTYRDKTEASYDAVKMSSQEPYPGDNELEALEKEIMEKWGMNEFPPMTVLMQDPQQALQEYKTSLQYRKAGNDVQALEKMEVCLLSIESFIFYLEMLKAVQGKDFAEIKL